MSTYTHDKRTGVVCKSIRVVASDGGPVDLITMFTVGVLKNDRPPLPPRIEQIRPELKLC